MHSALCSLTEAKACRLNGSVPFRTTSSTWVPICVARADPPDPLGLLDHPFADAVLDRTSGIHELALAEELALEACTVVGRGERQNFWV